MTRLSQFFRKLFPKKVAKVEKFTVEAPKPKAMTKFLREQNLTGIRHAFGGTFRPIKPLPGQRSGWAKFQERERIRRDKQAARRARETMKELIT
jgi:hypothetical protein